MPTFKSTYNILKAPWEDELFSDNWMDSDKMVLPAKKNWDYARPLQIEDVNIWEVIYQQGGGKGLYASWDPYAEFYMITTNNWNGTDPKIEMFYGQDAGKKSYKRAKELGMPISINKIWVEPEEMWLYQEPEFKSNTLILP